MLIENIPGVPAFEKEEYAPKNSARCLLIPVLNEDGRILSELARAQRAGVDRLVDIILCDGGSTDGSTEPGRLSSLGVNTLLIKKGPGRQGAQLRTGLYFALQRGYEAVLTVDGNDKDGIEEAPRFLQKLDEGYDFVQGSRFVPGGKAVNTPFVRWLSVRLLHAPLISRTAHFHFTDTTNNFRAYSRAYLTHPAVQPLRDIFSGYELLAYLSVRASQLGLRVCEVPVTRAYPKAGRTPTKISAVRGNAQLLHILFTNRRGGYNPT